MKKYKLMLFISGMSVNSLNAVDNIRKICDKYCPDSELEIIDINKQRHLAAKYQIIALPTLLKILPDPSRIVLGNLADTAKVLKILNITH